MLKNFVRVSFYLGLCLLVFSMVSFCYGVSFYLLTKVVFVEWDIFSFFGGNILMLLLLDWVSLTFLGFVLFISSLVMVYSTYYLSGDSLFYRFILLVYLFVLSMVFLIISPNLISVLLGWDGLGLVSYCLVIYYQNVKSYNSGMLTVLSNRVGDVALLLSIAWVASYGNWNFFFLQTAGLDSGMTILIFFVALAAITKSAQIPFSAWLPAAMAAPTPVSALVHSSTLVTAGVYLLIRFSGILGESFFLFYLGLFTMFMSGLSANFEIDLKKIIALSTLSQLGVMIMALSLGSMEFSFFHLLSHALFKSLLFLCAGVFIHSAWDTQDIRCLGSAYLVSPVSSLYFVVSSLSLCGFIFLSGFYSKDLILEYYFMGGLNLFQMFVTLVGTVFTASYSFRLGYFLFLKNLGFNTLAGSGEEILGVGPMSILFTVSVVAGSAMGWLYFPCLFIFLSKFWKLLILSSIFTCLVVFYITISMGSLKSFTTLNSGLAFSGQMWFLPYLSTIFVWVLLKPGLYLAKNMDQGWAEYFGGQGLNYTLSAGAASSVDYSYILSLKSFIFIFAALGGLAWGII